MNEAKCPKCGHAAVGDACPNCGHAMRNGAVPTRAKPPAPPEAANWVIYPTPPELLEHLRQTFDEAEFLAAARELEKTGGVRIDDLIAELERKVHGGS